MQKDVVQECARRTAAVEGGAECNDHLLWALQQLQPQGAIAPRSEGELLATLQSLLSGTALSALETRLQQQALNGTSQALLEVTITAVLHGFRPVPLAAEAGSTGNTNRPASDTGVWKLLFDHCRSDSGCADVSGDSGSGAAAGGGADWAVAQVCALWPGPASAAALDWLLAQPAAGVTQHIGSVGPILERLATQHPQSVSLAVSHILTKALSGNEQGTQEARGSTFAALLALAAFAPATLRACLHSVANTLHHTMTHAPQVGCLEAPPAGILQHFCPALEPLDTPLLQWAQLAATLQLLLLGPPAVLLLAELICTAPQHSDAEALLGWAVAHAGGVALQHRQRCRGLHGGPSADAAGIGDAAEAFLAALRPKVPELCGWLVKGCQPLLALLGVMGLCGAEGSGAAALSTLFAKWAAGSGGGTKAGSALVSLGQILAKGAGLEVSAWVEAWVEAMQSQPHVLQLAAMKALITGEEASAFRVQLRAALQCRWSTLFGVMGSKSHTMQSAAFDLLQALHLNPATAAAPPDSWATRTQVLQVIGALLEHLASAPGTAALQWEAGEKLLRLRILLTHLTGNSQTAFEQVVQVLLDAGLMAAVRHAGLRDSARARTLANSVQALVPAVLPDAQGRLLPCIVLTPHRTASSLNRRNGSQNDDSGLIETLNPALPLAAVLDPADLQHIMAELTTTLLICLRPDQGAANLTQPKVRPVAVGAALQRRLEDAFGPPLGRGLYEDALPRAPHLPWHLSMVDLFQQTPFLSQLLQGLVHAGGPSGLQACAPLFIAVMADCIARYSTPVQPIGQIPPDRADAAWVVGVAGTAQWIPPVLQACGGVLAQLAPAEVAAVLHAVWRCVLAALDETADTGMLLAGYTAMHDRTSSRELQRSPVEIFNVDEDLKVDMEAGSAAGLLIMHSTTERQRLMQNRTWRGLVLPLLHLHLAELGAQYGRFVRLLEGTQPMV